MNILPTKKYLAIAVVGLVLPLFSCAASFDCDKAGTAVEKLVCSDATVSQLDEQLAQAYKIEMEKVTNKEGFKHAQRTWLTEKRNACKDADCLMKIYTSRINELTPQSPAIDVAAKVSATAMTDNQADNPSKSNQAFAKPVFKLIKGSQYEVCRVFTDYLNSDYYKKGDCTIGAYPADKRLKSVPYKKVNIGDYQDYFISILEKRALPSRKELAVKRLKDTYSSGMVEAWIGEADIKNIGEKDIFLATRHYVIKEKVPPQFCESLGVGIFKLVDGHIDNSAWDGDGLPGPFVFDGRTFLIRSGGDGDVNSYSILEPASSDLKYYRNNQHYYGEVAIIEVCDIKPNYN